MVRGGPAHVLHTHITLRAQAVPDGQALSYLPRAGPVAWPVLSDSPPGSEGPVADVLRVCRKACAPIRCHHGLATCLAWFQHDSQERKCSIRPAWE